MLDNPNDYVQTFLTIINIILLFPCVFQREFFGGIPSFVVFDEKLLAEICVKEFTSFMNPVVSMLQRLSQLWGKWTKWQLRFLVHKMSLFWFSGFIKTT